MECKLVKIRENREISSGIFSLTFEGSFTSDPGQFFMVKLLNSEAFLPRPISVHDVDKGTLTMVYAVVGKGTSIMTSLQKLGIRYSSPDRLESGSTHRP